METLEIFQLMDVSPKDVAELVDVLTNAVNDGASVGFLAPLSKEDATEYWSDCFASGNELLVAKLGGRIVGTVQLDCCSKPNGFHRAEVVKLMVHTQLRNRGLGKKLMVAIEELAVQLNKSLLVLDTRDGDHSNVLYSKCGFTLVGTIPSFALSSNGNIDGTNIYYKIIK